MLWGFSKVSCHQDCPKKYEHRYVLGTKPDGAGNPDLAFGSALHSAINAALLGESPYEVFAVYWNSYKDKEMAWGRMGWRQLGVAGETLIRKFQKKYLPRFEIVAAEKTLQVEYNGILFEGTIDLLAKFDGVLTLVDFKTTSTRYDSARAAVSFQLHLYAYLCEKAFGQLPDQLMYLPFMKGGPATPAAIQGPVIAPLIKDRMDAALKDFAALVPVGKPNFPRNFNACLNYGRRCEFFNTCHGAIEEGESDGEEGKEF